VSCTLKVSVAAVKDEVLADRLGTIVIIILIHVYVPGTTKKFSSFVLEFLLTNLNTGLFEMIVAVLATYHTQHTSDRSIRQGSGLCSSSSRKYPVTEGTNQNRH